MGKMLFNISSVSLLVLLAMHVLAAMIWGNWDQEGTGSLGFWPVFPAAVAYFAWLYGFLIVIVAVTCVLSGGRAMKGNVRREQ